MPAERAGVATPPARSRASRAIASGAVLFAVAYLTMPFTEATGGRGPLAVTKAAVVVVVALAAVKPWRELRSGVLALAAVVGLAALAVCLLTTPGWFGATRAASYGLGAATFVAVAAYVRNVRQMTQVALLVVAAGVMQFAWAFVPWRGGEIQSKAMVGTFYWHNQYGAFLLAPTLIGLCLAIGNRAPWRLAGWVVVPLGTAGVVYSSSRGAMAALAAGWVIVGVLAVTSRKWRGATLRWFAAAAIALGATFVIAGPPFFASSASPLSATQAREKAGESVDANSEYRLHMWRESVSVFEHHPLAGVGYGGLVASAVQVTPAGWPRSPLSHNDYLQALTEGGLLLGLPFLIGCAAIGIRLLRVSLVRVRRRCVDVRTGICVGALALMAHAAIDFDWTYPALFALAAILAGAAIGPTLPRPAVRHSSSTSQLIVRVAAVGVLAVVVIVGGIAGRKGGNQLSFHFDNTRQQSSSLAAGPSAGQTQ